MVDRFISHGEDQAISCRAGHRSHTHNCSKNARFARDNVTKTLIPFRRVWFFASTSQQRNFDNLY